MDIDVNYKLKITGLHTAPAPIQGFSNIITRIDWSLTASSDIEDINHRITKIGSTLIDFYTIELSIDNFIDYYTLTEQQIVSWVEEIDKKFLDTVKMDCKNEIINFLFKTTNQTPLPWNITFLDSENLEQSQKIISLNENNLDNLPHSIIVSRQPRLEKIPDTVSEEISEQVTVKIERVLPIPPLSNPPDSELISAIEPEIPVDPVVEETPAEEIPETP